MVKHLLGFVFLTIGIACFAAAEITATVSQSEIYDDESFLLTVSISPKGTITSNDLKALESLFKIESRSQSSEFRSVNGRNTSVTNYQFRLSPKRVGTLGIPNFHANGEQSQPVFINVLDSENRQDNLPDDAIIVSASFDKSSAYINETITLTLKVAMKISVEQPTFENLNDLGIELTPIGDTTGQENINGSLYNVYTLGFEFSQAEAGLLSLPDIKFTALFPNRSLGRYEKFTRKANTGALEIKPVPANYPANAYWLPLRGLNLIDNLPNQLTVAQNEHQTWNLQLTAVGADGTQLPDLLKIIEAQLDAGIKLYKNPAQIEGNQRTESAALGFINAGNYTLPAIKVPWWNLTTDSLEWAELPSRDVTVTAAPLANPLPINPSQQNLAPTVAVQPEIIYRPNPLWIWLSCISTLGWLTSSGLAIYFYRKRNRTKTNQEVAETFDVLQANDLSNSYQAYLSLANKARQQGSDINSLMTDAQKQLIQQLERHLYQDQSQKPELKAIQSALKVLTKQVHTKVTATKKTLQLLPITN